MGSPSQLDTTVHGVHPPQLTRAQLPTALAAFAAAVLGSSAAQLLACVASSLHGTGQRWLLCQPAGTGWQECSTAGVENGQDIPLISLL